MKIYILLVLVLMLANDTCAQPYYSGSYTGVDWPQYQQAPYNPYSAPQLNYYNPYAYQPYPVDYNARTYQYNSSPGFLGMRRRAGHSDRYGGNLGYSYGCVFTCVGG